MAKKKSTKTRDHGSSPRAKGEPSSARQGGGSAQGGDTSATGGYVSQVKDALSNVEVAPTVLSRGVTLWSEGRVARNKTYPWIFTVTGDRNPAKGVSLYAVDLRVPECSCAYYLNTNRICKHIVAASCMFREKI